MPDRAAGEVTADRHADDRRAREHAVGTPPDGRRLRLDLRHRRPDVVEELDLGARPQAAYRLPDRAPDDVGLGQRRVVAARLAELTLEPEGDTEDSALARHLVEHPRVGVGDVLTEHPDALVARHLLVQRAPDRLAERDLLAVVGWIVGHVGDDCRAQHLLDRGLGIGPARRQRLLRSLGHGGFGLGADLLGLLLLERAVADERALEREDRVVLGLVDELVLRAVLLLVVGERVRVRAGDERVDEPRALPGSYAVDRLRTLAAHFEVVAPVDVGDVEATEAHDHLGDRPGCLVAGAHRYRVAVVGDDVEDGQPETTGGVEALPELALGARTLAQRDVRELVTVGRAPGQVAPGDVA